MNELRDVPYSFRGVFACAQGGRLEPMWCFR